MTDGPRFKRKSRHSSPGSSCPEPLNLSRVQTAITAPIASYKLASRPAGFWVVINHGHAFREGNTCGQTVFFEQLAHHAGWTLDVSRLAPHHPSFVYRQFVDARFEHQRIRDASGGAVAPGNTGAPSAQEAARQLSDVLLGLIEADSSPEGRLRRGEVEPKVAPVQRVQPAVQHARHPELRGMKLDPYGLADDIVHSAGDDYQP